MVVAGHVAALMLAHDRALALYRDAAQAVRSQYWMLGVMLGFTMLPSGSCPRRTRDQRPRSAARSVVLALGLAAGVFVICALASIAWIGLCENAVGTSRESLCTVETDGFQLAVAALPPLAILAVA